MTWVRGRNKFNARAVDGFPSKLEKSIYELLKEKEINGEIENIKRQPRVLLTRANISWKVDFMYYDKEFKQYCWAEAKGVETSDYRIKKKLWRFYGPGRLYIYKGNYKNPKLVEIIYPQGEL